MRRSLSPLLGCMLLAGCSYDWSPQGARPSADGGAEADASPVIDSGAMDAPAADTAGDVSISDSSMPEVEAGNSCASRLAQLQADLQAAQACLVADINACKSVTDECGCQVAVGQMGSAAAQAYTSAVSDFASAGCGRPAVCPDACPAPLQGCPEVDGGPWGRCLQ